MYSLISPTYKGLKALAIKKGCNAIDRIIRESQPLAASLVRFGSTLFHYISDHYDICSVVVRTGQYGFYLDSLGHLRPAHDCSHLRYNGGFMNPKSKLRINLPRLVLYVV